MHIDAEVLALVKEYAAVEFDGQCDIALAELIRNAYSAWKHAPRVSSKPQSKKTRNWRQSVVTALSIRDGGYQCQRCGSTTDICIDHVYPESLGGTSELDNLQLLCRNCNSIKGTSLEAEQLWQ